METLRLPSFARFATFVSLLSAVFAQENAAASSNGSSTAPDTCPLNINQGFSPDAPINSTGSVNVHWNSLMMDPARNDWIITLTYNETRNRQAQHVDFVTQHHLQAYISAPEASEAQACIHMFGSLNATAASNQRNGCDGVLDAGCLSFLSNVTFSTDCSLPNPGPEWLDDLREACGADVVGSLTSSNDYLDFADNTCTIDHPPGFTSPDGYRTWAAIGRALMEEQIDTDLSSFAWYDLHVRQTVPFLVTANFGGVTEAQVVCVAPDQVVEGGREPAQRSGAACGWPNSIWTMIAAFVVNGVVNRYL